MKILNKKVDNSDFICNFAPKNQLNPVNMITWSEYEEKYGESREDFYEEPETSWEQSEADAAGVPLFGPI